MKNGKPSFGECRKLFIGRRKFIKVMVLTGAAALLADPFSVGATPADTRMIIAYFSHSGNTRMVAREIQAFTHAAMAEILPVSPFPDNYNALVQLAEKQARENFRPEFRIDPQEDLNSFNVIFLGFPIWAYTMPMLIYSFLDKYKFPNKTIAPFCTHMGSGLADSQQKIRLLCPNATVLPGLAIRGTSASHCSVEVKEWLQKNGLV